MQNKHEVTLAHGSGGKASDELVRQVLLPALGKDSFSPLPDSAVLDNPGKRLAFTTDSFTVSPLFFPGGNIGRLAVFGTVNDIAMSGAAPLYLSLALIIEEGLKISLLKEIMDEIAKAAQEAQIAIVTGDTKVVGKGAVDLLFINTSGIGVLPDDRTQLSPDAARPGDTVIVSGALGDHGIAVLGARENLSFTSDISSDCAPLATLAEGLLVAAPETKCLRDPTRGGVASVLNEIARESDVGVEIEESSIPIHAQVRGLSELLGLDPLYMANEGKLIAIVPSHQADNALAALHSHKFGREAEILGRVTADHRRTVVIKTSMGTRRILDYPTGELLPRIC